jgi:hypothetical protein
MRAMTRPRPAFFSESSRSAGSLARQGAHQVAQKSSSTTFPLRSARGTCRPSSSVSTMLGAGEFCC